MKIGTRAGKFIDQFHGPKPGSNIVCFKFHKLAVAMGCGFRCAYCFLMTTPYFTFNQDKLMGLVYRNVDEMVDEVRLWLENPVPGVLVAGELQDGLLFDSAYKRVTGKPLTHRLVPHFAAQDRHRLLFLTKSTMVQNLLEFEPTDRVLVTWSVNADEVAARWEHGAPPPSQRFAAAARVKAAGWPVRVRLDPMVPIPGWQDAYARAIDRINELEPEMVTIGALRATSPKRLRAESRKHGRDDSIFDYLTEERDPSGFKYRIPFETQVEMFRFALDRLSPHVVPALCKEDATLWNALGMEFRGCHCLHGADDALAVGRAGAPYQV